MEFPTFCFRKKHLAKIVAVISLVIPIISFCDGSIIHQASHEDGDLKQSEILNGNATQEDTIKLRMGTEFRKDSTDDDIRLLKNETETQREENLEMKLLLPNLLHQQSNNETINEQFNTISVERATRSVKTSTSASSSWAKIEISDLVIGYMDYDTYSVKIYSHASNKDINMKNEEKKYYFVPIGQLEHLSAKSNFNNVSKTAEMIFKVNMWTDKVRAAVHKFISDDLKLGPVNINLVRVLPLDEVMMFSGSRPSPHFEIDRNWINYQSDKFLKFKFVCDKKDYCDHLAAQMKTNPEQFKLKMRFSLSSQNSQRKETKINIDTIMSGEMMNQLDQKFKGKELVLLTADGKNQLLKESSENIIIQTVDDFQIPTTDSRSEVYRRLESMLQFGRTIIQKGDEKAWQNVFWNQDNYRPDMSARIVTDVYDKLDGVNQKKFVSSFTNTVKVGFEAGASALGGVLLSGTGGLNLEISSERVGSQESLETALREARDRVEWDGIKFVPKQMELYSMNMARLKNKQTFKDMNVKISYTTSMLTIDVRHDSSFDLETSSEFSKLKAQVEATSNELSKVKARDSGYHSTGIFVWRITNYRSKKADTKVTQIYSDPFYSSRFGYKLKMDARLNGDGQGKGTHLSIYMEIQPGEYDALLSWPFSHKVTFTLLDQLINTKEKNNVEEKIYDSTYSKLPHCFQRPLNNKANEGVGQPKFASHELVEGGKVRQRRHPLHQNHNQRLIHEKNV